MSTTNGEKDSLLGQTVLSPELGQIFGGLGFFAHPLVILDGISLTGNSQLITQLQVTVNHNL